MTARGNHRDRDRDVDRDRGVDRHRGVARDRDVDGDRGGDRDRSVDRDRDAGRVSVFLAIGLLAVFMIIGLSVDGAGQLFAMQRAHNIAAEAARVGGQAIDEGQAINGGPKVLDRARAEEAATAYLSAVGVTGDFPRGPDDPDGPQVFTVHVTTTYHPIMLDFFGWDSAMDIQGTATAQLLDAPAP